MWITKYGGVLCCFISVVRQAVRAASHAEFCLPKHAQRRLRAVLLS